MKILIVTNLFPNAAEPNRSTFNFQQFSELAKLCEVKVVAPVPCFQYSREQVPAVETIGGIEVFHPRYLVIPKTLRWTYGLTFFLGIWHTLQTIYSAFKYDAILAAWCYPDACGAAIAAGLLKKNFFVKVHGSDINLAGQYCGRTAMIKWALSKAERVIAVSQPLKQKIMALGIPEHKIVVLPNGVNKAKFFHRDQHACRRQLGLDTDKKYILYVGNLVEVKGVEYLIKALKLVDGADLLLVGEGPLKASLTSLADTLGIKDRVYFKGRQSHDQIPIWLSAVDVFCLPSLNEGCPNVVLEALACGCKVVASNVGGVPDIIDTPDKGWLVKPKDPEDLAQCLNVALNAPSLATQAKTISWEENASILSGVINSHVTG